MGPYVASSSKTSYLAKFKSSEVSSRSSLDCHRKVECKERRIRLSVECAKRVFELNKRLGHRTSGETIEWLLMQAKPAIDVVLGTGPFASSLDPPVFADNMPFASSTGVAFPTPPPSISVGETLASINPRACDELETNVGFSADEIAKILFPESLM